MANGGHIVLAAGLAFALAGTPAVAACPQELAVYEGADGSGALEFAGGGAGMLSEMRLLYDGVEPVTAYLSHDEVHDRTEAMIPLNCPEGDVTGDELAACLVYQGTVYSIDADSVGLLPHPGEAAAAQIFLPNLLPALWENPQFGDAGPKEPPAEIFKLSGCQE
ncbi:hypothetical protein E2A64_00590 [Pseudohoeflea suaedae]|uniref:Uncharacterized protein n=1 Tax=Pseudohoeflea suaedae TaxID=877384 RepID=A0A4R5PMF2_9HYPH|nr:hypothetical protein [Pseudohoeflea suaedae]TDH37677.1 hypothetical protein E2A64_00590 [Pseudohoeflea suaedae]